MYVATWQPLESSRDGDGINGEEGNSSACIFGRLADPRCRQAKVRSSLVRRNCGRRFHSKKSFRRGLVWSKSVLSTGSATTVDGQLAVSHDTNPLLASCLRVALSRLRWEMGSGTAASGPMPRENCLAVLGIPCRAPSAAFRLLRCWCLCSRIRALANEAKPVLVVLALRNPDHWSNPPDEPWSSGA